MKKSRAIFLRICLVLVVLYLGTLGVLWIWNGTRIGHAIRFPSENVVLNKFSFTSPTGWVCKVENDTSGERRLASICRWLFKKAEDFPESHRVAHIRMYFSDNENGLPIETGYLVRRHEKLGAIKGTRKIDNKETVVYRYQGFYHFSVDSPLEEYLTDIFEENPKHESVSITVTSDFGFRAVFWGLPEHESIFWSTIDSIKWGHK